MKFSLGQDEITLAILQYLEKREKKSFPNTGVFYKIYHGEMGTEIDVVVQVNDGPKEEAPIVRANESPSKPSRGTSAR